LVSAQDGRFIANLALEVLMLNWRRLRC